MTWRCAKLSILLSAEHLKISPSNRSSFSFSDTCWNSFNKKILSFIRWLNGLGVWFLLWVQEVSSSNLDWAQLFDNATKILRFMSSQVLLRDGKGRLKFESQKHLSFVKEADSMLLSFWSFQILSFHFYLVVTSRLLNIPATPYYYIALNTSVMHFLNRFNINCSQRSPV